MSGNEGPVATADTSAFPAVLNASRIAAIFENVDLPTLTVVVNKALSANLPTHINLGFGEHVSEHTSQRIALTQHGADIVVGGQTYVVMRAAGSAIADYIINSRQSRPPQDPILYFSLEYSDGFIEADGSLDRGTTQAIGHYESQGNGLWRTRATVIEEIVGDTDAQVSFGAYGIKASQALPYPDESYLAVQVNNTGQREVNTSGIISRVSSAGDTNLDRFSLASGVYEIDVFMQINRNATVDRSYTIAPYRVSGTTGFLAQHHNIGPVRKEATTGPTTESIQTTFTVHVSEPSTIEMRARRTTPVKTSAPAEVRAKDTTAGGGWFTIKRLGAVSSETFLSSPALSRHPVQGVFFQYTNTGIAPAFSAEYRDDVGWHNYGSWVHASIPTNQPPGGGTLYSATTLAVWENSAWVVRTAVIEQASINYGVQYSATNTATTGSTTYNSSIHNYVRFRQSNGYWGPWISLAGRPTAATQLWQREANYDSILRTAAHFDLNDWNEIGFSVENKGAANPPQPHRRQMVWLNTNLISSVPAYNASVGTIDSVNGVENYALIRLSVGGPNRIQAVSVGGDGHRSQPTGTWSPYDGIDMSLYFYRGLSDTDATSRAVRGIQTMERVGDYANPVILTLWGR